MHAVIQSLHAHSWHSLLDSFLNSPHHLMVYAAIAAVLLVGIPLRRALFGTGGSSRGSTALNIAEAPIAATSNIAAASPSMLGLASSPIAFEPAFEPEPAPIERKPVASVTAINGALTVPCIHCGVTMSSRQDFCPACGYAQPMKQIFTA